VTPLAFDTETWRFCPGLQAPRLVCVSMSDGQDDNLTDADDGTAALHDLCYDPDKMLVGHNVAFDAIVTMAHDPDRMKPAVFNAYREGRVSCTLVREKLIRLAHGETTVHATPQGLQRTDFKLSTLVKRYVGSDITSTKKGPDAWRTRYAELDGVPIEQWPQAAVDYAIDDARLTLAVWKAQQAHEDAPAGAVIDPDTGMVINELDQVRAHLALMLMTTWGLRTDPGPVAALKAALTKEVEAADAQLIAIGLKKVDKKGKVSRNMKAIKDMVSEAFGGHPPLTDKGGVSTSKETLDKCDPDKYPGLALLAEITGSVKVLNDFVPNLESGTLHPTNPQYDILKETGRTSSYNFNVQQLPRKGGVRECFIPRPGYVYAAIDYDTLELRALAQTCLDLFGWSRMAEALQAGIDPHLDFAADILDIDYETAQVWRLGDAGPEKKKLIGETRQMAKAANFGYPGGLGDENFMKFAWVTYGVRIAPDKAKGLKRAWFEKYPEMRLYFKHVNSMLGGKDKCPVILERSGLIRGEASYCAACNMFFQGLAAVGAKRALWLVADACYAQPDSPAYGARPVAFIHDEILVEIPEDVAGPAALEIARLMSRGMADYIPDIPITCEPALMSRWYKNAEPAYDEQGNLILWRP